MRPMHEEWRMIERALHGFTLLGTSPRVWIGQGAGDKATIARCTDRNDLPVQIYSKAFPRVAGRGRLPIQRWRYVAPGNVPASLPKALWLLPR